ncbi:MAG: DUF6456 domain-containing protein [Rhizobiaceae bacterium]
MLRFLGSGPAAVEPATDRNLVMLTNRSEARIAVAAALCHKLARAGLIAADDGKIRLSPDGLSRLSRLNGGQDAHLQQHAQLETRTIDTDTGPQAVSVNLAESPLARLARLKTPGGNRFLERREWRAGDRLRGDFTRAQMQPQLGINWQAEAGGGHGAAAGGRVEITDAALAARQRVEQALAAVGPELSGILIDVCCFLKGLATVESERGWPVRSAKVVLKTALTALARHYEPERGENRRADASILHWGAPGYRPPIRS